ncbi:unnamed protein product [Zymoseptoria tritici ST99CH_3D7]|uniref:Uncharacterized protein n=1 Tax=Zymoseptoria tritici (strain ST99CH_3D7) TaxID=1276538 RepID=A0A1X7S7H5_ZYMT9|nr:unnamed protein product [Zymoseptoria tritici ST99CH_3D7]
MTTRSASSARWPFPWVMVRAFSNASLLMRPHVVGSSTTHPLSSHHAASSPPRRLFATVGNMIVWFDPKHKSDAFVKLTAYADLDLDFTIFYPEDDALAPRIQEVDDAPAVADADAEKENQPPPQKKTKLFPMFGGK